MQRDRTEEQEGVTPIVRTYLCPECNHYIRVTLTMEQAEDPPPSCPACDAREMRQDFKAPAIVNSSPYSRAQTITEDILAKDYHVANIHRDRHEGSTPKVSYKDQTEPMRASNWGLNIPPGAMSVAVNNGREIRKAYGSGLDMLQGMLKSGAQQDLIEVSKKRSMKIW